MRTMLINLLKSGAAAALSAASGLGCSSEPVDTNAPNTAKEAIDDGPISEAEQALDCLRFTGPVAWNCAGPIPGMTCIRIFEPADPDTWGDNYMCTTEDFGFAWSFAGAIPGMRCTSVYEPIEPTNETWGDNYICAPATSHFHFMWSYAGPLAGRACLQWLEPADPHTWGDNFLCWLYF